MRIGIKLRFINHFLSPKQILESVNNFGNATVGTMLLLSLVMIFCATALRSVVQAQAASASYRKTVAARMVAEGVIRVVRALYAAHAQQILSACVEDKQVLPLALSDEFEKSLTTAIPGSRIMSAVFFAFDTNCLVADIQVLHAHDVPCIHIEILLDSVISTELSS